VGGVIRTYIENLNAIKVRPTGGVYFVHRPPRTLGATRELASRFGAGSHLVRIPLPPAAPGLAVPSSRDAGTAYTSRG